MFQKFIGLLLVILPSIGLAAEPPFTDVSTKASYYADLKHMYDAGVISDTADNLFRPDGLLSRDEFVGIVVWVSCRKCIYPSAEDILRYTSHPFVDILKKNQYFYCISYAKEKEIIRGYTLDSSGNTQCQDGKSFSEVPFCPANNITRIEASAVLLRQAGLWSESYNKSFSDKKIILSDVDDYWYGYAQKAVESWLITPDKDNKIFPNEYITRKEFVSMASKIFTINMCSVKNNANKNPSDFTSMIKIFDKEKNNCSEWDSVTTFPDLNETTYDFWGYTILEGAVSPLEYNWTFVNNLTSEQKIANGKCLNDFDLGSKGSWMVQLIITDANGKSSTAYQYVSPQDTGISLQIQTQSDFSKNPLQVSASTLYGTVGVPMPFFSIPKGWDGKYNYHWDFFDGGNSTEKNPKHIFMREGVYPVSLIVKDSSGNLAQAQLTVYLSPNLDGDNDGLNDYDNSGNILDFCPLVFGPKSNKWCPLVNEYRAWWDWNSDSLSDNSTINNLCLSNKIKESWMIEWSVACSSCPCVYSSEFIAKVRSCDIIFPSITSPDKKTLYSRGSIFAVP